jgi:thioredoxin reductase (NADPH)
MKGDMTLKSVMLQNVKTGDVRELAVSGVFEAVGNISQNAAFADAVTLDEEGYIVTDADCLTSARGIFAAGDCCRKRIRQLTTATSDGTVAALSAVEYLESGR